MKTKLICMMLLIVATTSITIFSCKKQDSVINSEQDINFFKRDVLLKNAFSKINGNLTDETLLDKVITEFKDYDKTKHISQDIITKFGRPKWDISVVLKNNNGFRTIITPISNDKNEITALALFYQNSINGFDYKIINRKMPQTKLLEYGDKEAKTFTKATLLGLFDVSEKNQASFYKTSTTSQIQTNSVGNQAIMVSWVCWFYSSLTTLADGTWSYTTTHTQCAYSISIDYQNIVAIGDDGSGNIGGSGGSSATNQPDPCEKQCADDLNALINNSQTASEEVGSDVTDIDAFTKNNNKTWIILKNLTWHLTSQELGKVKLIDATTNKWAWKSFTHGSISMNGAAFGGTISYDQGTATPSFTSEAAENSNIFYAGMSIDYHVTYAPVCNCPVISSVLVPVTIPYTSNHCCWEAKPQ